MIQRNRGGVIKGQVQKGPQCRSFCPWDLLCATLLEDVSLFTFLEAPICSDIWKLSKSHLFGVLWRLCYTSMIN